MLEDIDPVSKRRREGCCVDSNYEVSHMYPTTHPLRALTRDPCQNLFFTFVLNMVLKFIYQHPSHHPSPAPLTDEMGNRDKLPLQIANDKSELF